MGRRASGGRWCCAAILMFWGNEVNHLGTFNECYDGPDPWDILSFGASHIADARNCSQRIFRKVICNVVSCACTVHFSGLTRRKSQSRERLGKCHCRCVGIYRPSRSDAVDTLLLVCSLNCFRRCTAIAVVARFPDDEDEDALQAYR